VLAIDIGHGLTGRDVVATLERLRFERGLPKRIYCDNGTEFVSAAMDLWAYTNGVILDFSRRGKPIAIAAKGSGFDGLIYPSYFSLVRTGARPFDTAYGLSVRRFPSYREHARALSIPNVALFGNRSERDTCVLTV